MSCYICSEEAGPFMDPIPCDCKGSIHIHENCYKELLFRHTQCTICHKDFPKEYRNGLAIKRGFAEGTTNRYESTVNDDGEFHGTYTEFSDNGKIKEEIEYCHGVMHGQRKRYYNTGELYDIITYEMGIMHGPYKSCWQNGNKMEETEYSNGKMNGLKIMYHSNGNISEEGIYINGECHGIVRVYNYDGSLHVCSSFKYGKLDGYLFSFNKEMKIVSREKYENDINVETIRY